MSVNISYFGHRRTDNSKPWRREFHVIGIAVNDLQQIHFTESLDNEKRKH